jgi:hypothetical protein
LADRWEATELLAKVTMAAMQVTGTPLTGEEEAVAVVLDSPVARHLKETVLQAVVVVVGVVESHQFQDPLRPMQVGVEVADIMSEQGEAPAVVALRVVVPGQQ